MVQITPKAAVLALMLVLLVFFLPVASALPSNFCSECDYSLETHWFDKATSYDNYPDNDFFSDFFNIPDLKIVRWLNETESKSVLVYARYLEGDTYRMQALFYSDTTGDLCYFTQDDAEVYWNCIGHGAGKASGTDDYSYFIGKSFAADSGSMVVRTVYKETIPQICGGGSVTMVVKGAEGTSLVDADALTGTNLGFYIHVYNGTAWKGNNMGSYYSIQNKKIFYKKSLSNTKVRYAAGSAIDFSHGCLFRTASVESQSIAQLSEELIDCCSSDSQCGVNGLCIDSVCRTYAVAPVLSNTGEFCDNFSLETHWFDKAISSTTFPDVAYFSEVFGISALKTITWNSYVSSPTAAAGQFSRQVINNNYYMNAMFYANESGDLCYFNQKGSEIYWHCIVVGSGRAVSVYGDTVYIGGFSFEDDYLAVISVYSPPSYACGGVTHLTAVRKAINSTTLDVFDYLASTSTLQLHTFDGVTWVVNSISGGVSASGKYVGLDKTLSKNYAIHAYRLGSAMLNVCFFSSGWLPFPQYTEILMENITCCEVASDCSSKEGYNATCRDYGCYYEAIPPEEPDWGQKFCQEYGHSLNDNWFDLAPATTTYPNVAMFASFFNVSSDIRTLRWLNTESTSWTLFARWTDAGIKKMRAMFYINSTGQFCYFSQNGVDLYWHCINDTPGRVSVMTSVACYMGNFAVEDDHLGLTSVYFHSQVCGSHARTLAVFKSENETVLNFDGFSNNVLPLHTYNGFSWVYNQISGAVSTTGKNVYSNKTFVSSNILHGYRTGSASSSSCAFASSSIYFPEYSYIEPEYACCDQSITNLYEIYAGCNSIHWQWDIPACPREIQYVETYVNDSWKIVGGTWEKGYFHPIWEPNDPGVFVRYPDIYPYSFPDGHSFIAGGIYHWDGRSRFAQDTTYMAKVRVRYTDGTYSEFVNDTAITSCPMCVSTWDISCQQTVDDDWFWYCEDTTCGVDPIYYSPECGLACPPPPSGGGGVVERPPWEDGDDDWEPPPDIDLLAIKIIEQTGLAKLNPKQIYDFYIHYYDWHYTKTIKSTVPLYMCRFENFDCDLVDEYTVVLTYPQSNSTVPNTPFAGVNEKGYICPNENECFRYPADLTVWNLNWRIEGEQTFVLFPFIAPNGINLWPPLLIFIVLLLYKARPKWFALSGRWQH